MTTKSTILPTVRRCGARHRSLASPATTIQLSPAATYTTLKLQLRWKLTDAVRLQYIVSITHTIDIQHYCVICWHTGNKGTFQHICLFLTTSPYVVILIEYFYTINSHSGKLKVSCQLLLIKIFSTNM